MRRDDETEDEWIRPEDAKTARQLIHYAGMGVRFYIWLFKLAFWVGLVVIVSAVLVGPI